MLKLLSYFIFYVQLQSTYFSITVYIIQIKDTNQLQKNLSPFYYYLESKQKTLHKLCCFVFFFTLNCIVTWCKSLHLDIFNNKCQLQVHLNYKYTSHFLKLCKTTSWQLSIPFYFESF